MAINNPQALFDRLTQAGYDPDAPDGSLAGDFWTFYWLDHYAETNNGDTAMPKSSTVRDNAGRLGGGASDVPDDRFLTIPIPVTAGGVNDGTLYLDRSFTLPAHLIAPLPPDNRRHTSPSDPSSGSGSGDGSGEDGTDVHSGDGG